MSAAQRVRRRRAGGRAAGIIATVVASVLLLSGCGLPLPTFLDRGPVVSTPTGEDVPEELRPFYEQVLEWSDCGNDMQCATATAPLDWWMAIEGPATGGTSRRQW